ncbi:MAG: J domain-containing protein [Actinomycetota bacterium]|nr:J domain-containing protein [Actinomycetota bacterium]
MAKRRPSDEGPDPYAVLGVSRLATLEEVTAAYRALAQTYHPDRHVDSAPSVQREADQRMREVNQAFLVLKKGSWVAATPESQIHSWATPDPNAGFEARRRASTASRQHTAQARAAQASRTQAKLSIPAGQARAMPRGSAGQKIGFGLAQALITNQLTCRTCQSVQHLPAGWQDQLRETDWSCSACGRIILAWR